MRISSPKDARWSLAAAVAALAVLFAFAAVASACSSDATQTRSESTAERADDGSTDAPLEEPRDEDPSGSLPPSPGVEPQPFIPTGRVGAADALAALIDELEPQIPAELRNQVPWPDIGNPDPVQAQLAIFDLWIWMEATNPEPALVELVAAPSSPSREDIAGTFGTYKARNWLRVREQSPYTAFDHRVVTFETAGLPLWLARDVPSDAVVIYYQDRSGPVTTRDRQTRDVVDIGDAVGNRQWLSIMVPTEVGWLLYRDQVIEPNDSELRVPDQLLSPNAGSRNGDL